MRFEKIVNTTTPQKVIEQILGAIESGELVTGEKLPSERNLSKYLGISRSTIREAITTLAALGILEVRQGSGTFVRTQSFNSTIYKKAIELLSMDYSPFDALESRLLIEPGVARLAAERIELHELEEIERLMIKMEKNPSLKPLLGPDDKDFHMLIAQASRNPFLAQMNSLALEYWFTVPEDPWDEVMSKILNAPGRKEIYLEQNCRIYEALKAGDGNQAYKAVEEHILTTQEDSLSYSTWLKRSIKRIIKVEP